MTTAFIIVIVIVVGITMGIKVYLQERDAQKEKEIINIEYEKNQQVVAERIAEIVAFENEVADNVKVEAKAETEPVKPSVEQKKPNKKKRYYSPKKSQAKGKNKK